MMLFIVENSYLFCFFHCSIMYFFFLNYSNIIMLMMLFIGKNIENVLYHGNAFEP